MSNGKATIILLTVGLIKKILLCKMRCFPEPHTCSKNKMQVELDFSNCETRSDLQKRNRC